MIIGIGGVSRAGKTTLSEKLKKRLKGNSIKLFNQDDYVKKTGLPIIKNHIDWEHPDSIDWKRLKKEVRAARETTAFVIVEGLFAFYDRALARAYDHSVFVQIDKEVFFSRKRRDLRWGKEPEWFIRHIWNSYQKYGKLPPAVKEVTFVNGALHTDLDPLVHLIRAGAGS
jgi:uridine kinase